MDFFGVVLKKFCFQNVEIQETKKATKLLVLMLGSALRNLNSF